MMNICLLVIGSLIISYISYKYGYVKALVEVDSLLEKDYKEFKDRKSFHAKSNINQYGKRKEIEQILDNMYDMIRDYGYVTMRDYKSIIGEDIDFGDIKLGWYNLKDAKIIIGYDGYKISLPKPVYID